MTLEGGTLTCSSGTVVQGVGTDSNITINGGTVYSKNNGSNVLYNSGLLKFNGGQLYGTSTGTPSGSGVYNASTGTVEMSGGEIARSMNGSYAIYNNGSFIMTGGELYGIDNGLTTATITVGKNDSTYDRNSIHISYCNLTLGTLNWYDGTMRSYNLNRT